MTVFLALVRSASGVTAIEYGLLAALIAVVIIVAVFTAGQALSDIFASIADLLLNIAGGKPPFPDPCEQGGTNCGG